MNNKAFLKIFFGGLSLLMVYLVIVTSLKSNLFQLPEAVLNEPWFWTTLTDFYFNIAILAVWVFYRERSKVAAALWVLGFICLGSIATCFYVFLQLQKLKADEQVPNILLRKV